MDCTGDLTVSFGADPITQEHYLVPQVAAAVRSLLISELNAEFMHCMRSMNLFTSAKREPERMIVFSIVLSLTVETTFQSVGIDSHGSGRNG